jgi:hypothetical protein
VAGMRTFDVPTRLIFSGAPFSDSSCKARHNFRAKSSGHICFVSDHDFAVCACRGAANGFFIRVARANAGQAPPLANLRTPVVGQLPGQRAQRLPGNDHRIGAGFAQLHSPDGFNRIGRQHRTTGQVAGPLWVPSIAALLPFDRQKTFWPYPLSETCFSIAKNSLTTASLSSICGDIWQVKFCFYI